MKKILTLIVALMATTAVAHAQFGIIGGWTTSRTSINTKNFNENFKGLDNFHAGIAYKVKLPLGFAVQPELTYEMKGAKIDHPDGVFVGLSPVGCRSVGGPSFPGGGTLCGISVRQ